ncbi:MAG: ATP-binding protein [Desulfatiglandales bacterium]
MQGDLADYHNGLELSRSYFIKARDFTNAGIASIQIKGFLKELGYGSQLVRKVSICAYEAEMNVVMYGSDGQVKMDLYPHLLCLRVEDHGPGIEDIELAMQEGYSTAPPEYREMGFGAGMGLPNMKKNSDFMEIISSPEKGTLVHMDFFLQA